MQFYLQLFFQVSIVLQKLYFVVLGFFQQVTNSNEVLLVVFKEILSAVSCLLSNELCAFGPLFCQFQLLFDIGDFLFEIEIL